MPRRSVQRAVLDAPPKQIPRVETIIPTIKHYAIWLTHRQGERLRSNIGLGTSRHDAPQQGDHAVKYEDFRETSKNGNDKAEKALDFLRDFYLNSSAVLRECAHQYDIETVKHLALVNSAGIGAAIALLTANQQTSTVLLQISAGLFGCGLLLAVILMYSASQLLFSASGKIMKKWDEFSQNQIDHTELSIESSAGAWWMKINIALGFTSLLVFLIGITCCVVFAAQKA